MIYGALSYKEMIDNGKIKPDYMGKIPLDMSQYQKIFGTTRNPKKPRDQLAYHPGSKHFVVGRSLFTYIILELSYVYNHTHIIKFHILCFSI